MFSWLRKLLGTEPGFDAFIAWTIALREGGETYLEAFTKWVDFVTAPLRQSSEDLIKRVACLEEHFSDEIGKLQAENENLKTRLDAVTTSWGKRLEQLEKKVGVLEEELADLKTTPPTPVPTPTVPSAPHRPTIDDIRRARSAVPALPLPSSAPITDDDVRAMCRQACSELGRPCNPHMTKKVLEKYPRDNPERLFELIKDYFYSNQLKILFLNTIGLKVKEATPLQEALAQKVANRAFEECGFDKEAAKKWGKAKMQAGLEIIQIANQEGYTSEPAGGDTALAESIEGFAEQLAEAEALQAEEVRNAIRDSFRSAVATLESIKKGGN